MVAKRKRVLEASWYRPYRPFSAVRARGNIGETPHLCIWTKYWPNHNHREFNGHRFWRAYLPCCNCIPWFYGGVSAEAVPPQCLEY